MADKSAANVIAAIAKSRKTTLARFIFALGIRHVGETTAKDLARHFGKLDALLAADEPALLDVPEVGPVLAQSIRQFFAEAHNREVIAQLRAAGVEWPETSPQRKTAGKLAGLTFVLTGTLPTLAREDAKQLIEEQAGKSRAAFEEDELCRRRRRSGEQARPRRRAGRAGDRRTTIKSGSRPWSQRMKANALQRLLSLTPGPSPALRARGEEMSRYATKERTHGVR